MTVSLNLLELEIAEALDKAKKGEDVTQSLEDCVLLVNQTWTELEAERDDPFGDVL